MNEIGMRGEAIFQLLITQFQGLPVPRFRPAFLGEKYPSIDYFVELVGVRASRPFFLAQVKATRQGYTRSNRLKVRFDHRDLAALAAYPVPTYAFAIDDERVEGFILSVNREPRSAIPSFPTLYPLNPTNRDRLWHEVERYWRLRKPRKPNSVFTEPGGS